MSEQPGANAPFKTLGTHLKYLREQKQESLAEVSGAVEIDEAELGRIENGHARPEEDILMLLINHFAMPDQEAVQLWELAGYDGAPDILRPAETPQEEVQKAVIMFMALDGRTIYSDGLDILCNQAGMTLSFTQAGGDGKNQVVSRIGMSYEQTERVLTALNQALLKAHYMKAPRQLPPGTDTDQPQ